MPLPLWVIYDHPNDCPDRYVARLWYGETPSTLAVTSKKLEWIRDEMERRGFVCVPRSEDDDPVIVETWI